MLELTGMLILAMPGIVLATGFLLFNSTLGLPERADGIVIFTNALMAIPYALKVLENPMRDVNSRYGLLCQSLGMQGWQRLKVVELRALKRPLAQALAFACVLSIETLGSWRCSAMTISARCHTGSISKSALTAVRTARSPRCYCCCCALLYLPLSKNFGA